MSRNYPWFTKINDTGIIASISVIGIFLLVSYLLYIGTTKLFASIDDSAYMLDVKKELVRVNHGDETKVIEYFYQQNKELTCKAMIEYLNWKNEKNENVIRLEVFPKFCLDDTKEMK